MFLRNFLFYALIAGNILAVIIGFIYYGDQLSATPPHLLLFVPDCPLYVLLAIPILLKLVKNDFYSFLVSAGLLKYGLWTIIIMLSFPSIYFSPPLIAVTLLFIAGHLIMSLEALALFPARRLSVLAVSLVLAWFLFNDFMDYAVGTRPSLPPGAEALAAAYALILTFTSVLLLHFKGKGLLAFAPAKWLRSIIFPQKQ